MSADRQDSLFPRPPGWPEGFRYEAHFLSREEETALMAELAKLAFRPFEFRGFHARREVVYFGWSYDFAAGRLERASPIPSILLPIRRRAAAFAGLAPEALAHVLVNYYPPGASIGWHRDRPQFQDVVGVSLGGAAPFRLRRRIPMGWERHTVQVAPRSIYLLRGPVRFEWEHSVPPVEGPRYSITFRSLTPRAEDDLPTALPS